MNAEARWATILRMTAMQINELTSAIIGAAIKVHKALGPGLLESEYRVCLAHELENQGLKVTQEQPIPVVYNDQKLDCGFRADLLINRLVIVELKAKDTLHPISPKFFPICD